MPRLHKQLEQPAVVARRIGNYADRVQYIKAILSQPLKYFCPNGAQERYINAIANCLEHTKIPTILPLFANGVGKSSSTVIALLNIIYKPQNEWFNHKIFRRFPFEKKIWYCSTVQAITDVIIPFFDEFANVGLNPEKEFKKDKQGRTFVSSLKFPNGWEVTFKTYSQDPSTYESSNVGIIVFDEPAPEVLWRATKSRRRMGCITLMPMTPLYCQPYVYDEIKKASDEGRKGYYSLKADVYQACQKRGVRGHLDASIIDDMVNEYDEDEKQARIYGDFMYFSSAIFQLLDRERHFVNADNFPIPKYSTLSHVVDPHDSRPAASIYAAKLHLQDPEIQRYIIFDETPQSKKRPYWDMKRDKDQDGKIIFDTDAEVKRWAAIEDSKQLDIKDRIMDRNFGWQTRGQKTFAELYLDGGEIIGKDFSFRRSYTGGGGDVGEVAFGHKQVQKMLKDQKDGVPGLLIYDNCFHTWNGLTHYIRRRLTGKTAEDRIHADAPIVDKYKDFPDCVRYLVCADVHVQKPTKQKSYTEELLDLIQRESVEGEGNEYAY